MRLSQSSRLSDRRVCREAVPAPRSALCGGGDRHRLRRLRLRRDVFDVQPIPLPPTPLPHTPVGGRLKFFAENWEEITSDPWVLRTVREGLTLKFKSRPPLSTVPIPVVLSKDPTKREALLQEV